MSPNENSTQLLLRPLYTPIDYLKHGIYYLRCPPFLLYGVQLQYTAPTPIWRLNEPYTPQEVYNEPLIPHSTRQPGYTCAAFRLPLHLRLGMCIGDLGWGPRTRHLVLYYTRPAVPLGWKSCCKQEDRRRIHTHTHTQGIQMGARAGTQDLTAISRQSTIKWKHGTNGRQGKIGIQRLLGLRAVT